MKSGSHGDAEGTPQRLLPPALSLAINQKHIPCIDFLRAFGALLVVMFHYRVPGASGSLGVVTFFVVSGFLITWLLLQEEVRAGAISLRGFYRRRALRIFPAFYVYLLVNLLVRWLAHVPLHGTQAAASAFYLSNYYQSIFGVPENGLEHTWSLAVEEQFYLLWPVVFIWLGSRRGRRFHFLLLAIAAIWMYRAVAVYGLHRNLIYVFESFETRADHILIGCLLAVVCWEARALRVLAWLSDGWWSAALVGFAVVAGTFAHRKVSPELRDTLFLSLDPVLVAAGVVVLFAHHRSSAVSWTGHSIVRFFGVVSYPIYLYQQGVADLGLFSGQPQYLALFAALGITIALASLSYYLVERPFLKWKRPATPAPVPREMLAPL